jgi:homocysteine S-methyltransferase
MSAIALAIMVQQQVGVETIVHCVTRDRNLLALQGDLLGMHALGLRNVLCLRGHVPRGAGTRAVGVWEVTPVGLIGILKGMNEGVDAAGERLDEATSFFIGGAATPTSPLEVEAKLMRRKKEAGVDFVITQPVYEAALVEEYVEAMAHLDIPIILGVMPLLSHRNAEFIHREMTGVSIPDEVRERMRRAGDEGPAEGLKIVRELIEAVREKVSGVCVMSSLSRFDVAAELVAWLRS